MRRPYHKTPKWLIRQPEDGRSASPPLINQTEARRRRLSQTPPPLLRPQPPASPPNAKMVIGVMEVTLPKHFKLVNPICFVSRSTPEGLVVSIHKHAFAFGKRLYSQLFYTQIPTALSLVDNSQWRSTWSIRSSANGSGFDPSPINNRGTRLIRAIRATQTKIVARIKELRRNLPMKVFFFLAGFYCATAFATVIGQTGDWDILSAALAVFVVEAIGALMYKGSIPLLNRVKSLITMFNYWKAGLSMGLFLDSFKY